MADIINTNIGGSKSILTVVTMNTLAQNYIANVLNPKVITVNKFTEDSVSNFFREMSEAENNNQEVIPIIIDSYGGDAYSVLPMVDIIKSSKKIIATISVGKSMSCGSILFSCGHDGYRFISPYSTLMIHDVSSGSWGKVEEIKADAAETDRLNKLVYTLMAKNCGKEEDYFMKIIHDRGHAEWYIDADEAVKHGLANHKKVPRFNIDINATMSFG